MPDNSVPSLGGLRHVALNVGTEVFDDTLDFYIGLLGMRIDWQPDKDNVYLTTGDDNLALHRMATHSRSALERLDHIGFVLSSPQDADVWQDKLRKAGVAIEKTVKTHRDSSRSFYCKDPGGVLVQFLYHPNL